MCDFSPASFGVRPDQTNPQRMFAHKMSLLAIVDTATSRERGFWLIRKQLIGARLQLPAAGQRVICQSQGRVKQIGVIVIYSLFHSQFVFT
jgi:hypothetical protein